MEDFLMRIYLVNLKKHAIYSRACALLLIITVLGASVIGVVSDLLHRRLYISAASTLAEKRVIIIDAGHGGEDSGAVGKGGVLEKDLNLEIALMLGEMLSERGFAVVYTRTDDRMLYKPEENIKGIRKISDLKNRLAVASEYPDALFISIHMNSFGMEKYSGLQTYYSVGNEDSRALADKLQESVRTELQTENTRKIKEGKDIYILENIPNTAVLLECGFITNTDECKRLCEKEYQKSLCFAIVCGIIEHINS